MKRIRAKFIKDESVKFLSHLDILRTFARALRRSGIPVVYSQGFNPHPSMSFALPLSVGVTSEGEYVDIDIEDSFAEDEFVQVINKGLPNGLRVISAQSVDLKSNIMAIVKMAKYRVNIVGEEFLDIDKKITQMLDNENIIVEKETKKGTSEVDIKNAIKRIEVLSYDENNAQLEMELDAGSQSNLKPDSVIKAMEKYLNINVDDFDTHRIELIY